MGIDGDPAVAKTTWLNTFAALAKDNELVFAPHFPFPGVWNVAARGDRFVWEPGVP